MQNKKPVVLIVMDGIGIKEDDFGNAVNSAVKPTLDKLMKIGAYKTIKAHGIAVGLPSDEDMGNSEVGHNALGCGQVYAQGAKLVNSSIETGAMYSSETWTELVENVKKNNSTLHFIGLLSDGNVHSNIEHLKAMINQAKKEQIKKVRIHVLIDGRDVPATSAFTYTDDLEKLLETLCDSDFDCRIASGGGRMKITMDRYQADWNMVKLGWDCHVLGKGRQFKNIKEAITTFRNEKSGILDQNLPPFIIADNEKAIGKIVDNDSVVLYNFRGDRAIEISRAFDEDDFSEFDREQNPKNVFFAGMLQYDGDLHIPNKYLVTPPDIRNTLSELLVKNHMKQYAVSETQKFGHVTYFWNGNKNEKFSDALEDFCEVPSDKISFDERPWMKCGEITDKIIDAINSKQYSFIRANFPNGDMVGHTGNFIATQVGVEGVDLCLTRILAACEEVGCALIVTADHGNADEMYEKVKSGEISPKTSHTLNPVPFIVYDSDVKYQFKDGDFGLANVAATVAQMLGLEKPEIWEESIIK